MANNQLYDRLGMPKKNNKVDIKSRLELNSTRNNQSKINDLMQRLNKADGSSVYKNKGKR